MRRYLIIANRTLGGHHLAEHVRGIIADRAGEIHVLVPVVEPSEAADAGAHHRLAGQLERLSALGAMATGEVVHADPYDAALAELRQRPADQVIVCTLPPGLSRWLGTDLVSRLRRVTEVEIVHIVAPAGMPERVTAQAVRLTIHIGERDHHGHTPLHTEIVQRARAAGLAGATVLRGVEGFGASSVIHTSRLLTLSEDLPMVVIIVDTPDRIDGFLPQLDELIAEGLVVRERVDIIKYEGRRGV